MSGRALVLEATWRAKGRTPFSRVVAIDVRPYVASRFQWGHVIGRLRQWWRSTGWFAGVPSLSVLSVLGREPPLYVRTYVGDTPRSHGRPLYHFRYRPARLGSPFSSVVELDSLCALHNPFCNSTLRTTGAPVSFTEIHRVRSSLDSLFSNLLSICFQYRGPRLSREAKEEDREGGI